MTLNKTFLLVAAPALLILSAQAEAQSTSTTGLSRQVSSLHNALSSWKDLIESRLSSLDSELIALRAGAQDILNNQNNAHNCANSRMLFNGSSCVALPTQTASAPSPSPSSPQVASTSAPQNDCTASPELCDIYSDVLGRSPDQAGALFWQDELNRLEQSGLTTQQASAQVRSQISHSNEATTGSMSVQETQDYNDYAQTHQVQQPTSSCSGSTSCSGGGTAHAIEQLYQQELGRSADAGGMEFYSNLLDSGEITIEDVISNLRSSPEAQGQ
jgi:hypothetical protein